jgi:hypothetical protein
MILPLLLLLLASPPRAVPAGDPPVKVWLNSDRIEPGDWARARVRVADDGYLLVLAADPEGQVRVLFPLDPSDDAFVRGGRTLDLRGRGNRGSFLVGDVGGTGVVLAARTAQPLRLTAFVRGGHWDYGALDSASRGPGAGAGAGAGAPRNPDELLLGLAQQMAGGNQFDYDVASYSVDGAVASGDGSPQPGYVDDGPAYGYGYPYWYGCYDPWFCGSSFFAGFGFGLFYSPFAYRPYYYPFIGRPVIGRPGYPRVIGYRNRSYIGSRYIGNPSPVQYRSRYIGSRYVASRSPGQLGSRARVPGYRSGGAPARVGSRAPRSAPPRMAMPSFRGGGGGRSGGGGGRSGGGGGGRRGH